MKTGMHRWKRCMLWALCIALCFTCAAQAEDVKEEIVSHYDEMLVPVDRTLKVRYHTTTGPMKAAGVTFSIDDESIATVGESGYVRGVSPGTCMLTITSKKDTGIFTRVPVRVVVELRSIKLSAPGDTLGVGQMMPLTCTRVPENATDTMISFSSTNEEVAVVDEEGNIVAIAPGRATIKAVSENGKKEATLRISVQRLPERVVVAPKNLMVSLKRSDKLQANILPHDADNQKVTWSSSDESIVRVDAKGKVTAVSPGEAVITAASQADESVYGSVTVRSVKPAESVRLEQDSFDVTYGQSFQLHPIVLPEDASVKEVTYQVLNRDICTVDENGIVTPLRTGMTKVQVTTADGSNKQATATIRCIIPPESLAFDLPAMRVGVDERAFAKVRVKPSGAASVTDLKWQSSDPTIASVTGVGSRARVVGHRWGQCVLTASTLDGKLAASTTVLVGNLRRAVVMTPQGVENGKLRVTVMNETTMPIVSLTFAIENDQGKTYIEVKDAALEPRGSASFVVDAGASSLRAASVAISAWQTSVSYFNDKLQERNSYRISPGLLEWHTIR